MDKRIYLLTMIAFVVGLVELIIGGILDLVAIDLEVSIGKAGLLITVFALAFGISGPILLFLIGDAERKRVTLVTLFIFFIGNLVALFSTTYSLLITSRIISAASGSLLVVLCLTLASHISKPAYRGRAIGLVIIGISGSIVLGLPIGVSLGHAFGWRSPFVIVAVLTIALAIAVHFFFGEVPSTQRTSLKKQLAILANNRILFGQLTTFFFLAAHFTLYGYLTPFVKTTFSFDGAMITLVYLIYGIAAVTGGGLGGIFTDKIGVKRTLFLTIIALAFCLFIMPYISFVLFWIVLIIWGVLSWSITPPVQTHLIQLAPETSDIQQSLNNAALHLGIAFGTFVGSAVVDRMSVSVNPHVGVIFAMLALLAASISLREKRQLT